MNTVILLNFAVVSLTYILSLHSGAPCYLPQQKLPIVLERGKMHSSERPGCAVQEASRIASLRFQYIPSITYSPNPSTNSTIPNPSTIYGALTEAFYNPELFGGLDP